MTEKKRIEKLEELLQLADSVFTETQSFEDEGISGFDIAIMGDAMGQYLNARDTYKKLEDK